jgi:hypothetical protein
MYLEISGRQTGKTTRMINQIYADKDKYDLQILMGINYDSLHIIKKQIKKNTKVKICLSLESFKSTILGYKNVRLYVDEFLYSNAFCNNFEKDFLPCYKDIITNGYYASSINTGAPGSMVFSKLKELNNDLISSMYKTTHPLF